MHLNDSIPLKKKDGCEMLWTEASCFNDLQRSNCLIGCGHQGAQYIVRKTPQGIEMITPEMLPKNMTTLMNQAASSWWRGEPFAGFRGRNLRYEAPPSLPQIANDQSSNM